MAIVSVENLKMSYDKGRVKALKGVTFDVEEGEIFGLIGPDGAGKTSLFRILTTLLLADSGKAVVDGMDVVNDYKKIRRHIGYMPGRFSLYQDLTVEENLSFFATVFNTTIEENYHLVEDIYRQIEPFKKRKAGKLSGGMKQRILLAQALLNDPEILILDEPTAGMDPEERIRIRNFISGCAKDKIVLLATHVVADVENMAREILLIKNGKIVRRDTPQKLLAELEHKVYNVLVTEREGEEYQNSGARITSVTLTEKGHRLRIINADALKTGNVEEVYPCLEDVYLYWIDRE